MYSKSMCRSSQDPHLYWTCSEVYRNAWERLKDHCIVLNGESGSGKTETFKQAIEYYAKTSCQNELLRNRMVKSNAILSVFGNAPTLANSNSSRFFNYFELKFNQDGVLYGAKINDFMLEKSRVLLDFPNERNFLIFYYLLSGLDVSMKEKLHLTDIQSHKVTHLPESLTNFQVNQWSESFAHWRTQFLAFGFKEDDLFTIYRMLAAIILLCDLEFTKIEANVARTGQTASVEVSYVHNFNVLCNTAELLCVNSDELMQVLTSTVQPGSKGPLLPKSWDDAVATRDNLARTLYHRLFGWIVKTINSSMNSEEYKYSSYLTLINFYFH